MNRKKFLRIGLGSLALTGLIGYQSAKAFRHPPQVIESILLTELHFLQHDQKKLQQFSTDLFKVNPFGWGKTHWRFLALYEHLKSLPSLLPGFSHYRRYRDMVVEKYLLSTNFFFDHMDEAKKVTYSGILMGPYTTPCVNPFAYPFHQPNA
jgi:hypothetical protein